MIIIIVCFFKGRGRKYFEYEDEMKAIFHKKVNLQPEYLLGVERNVETQVGMKPDNESVNEVTENVPPITEHVVNTVKRRPIINTNVTKQQAIKRRLTIGEKLRLDKKEFYTSKLEIEREKLKEIKKRTQVMQERSQNCCCKCKCNKGE